MWRVTASAHTLLHPPLLQGLGVLIMRDGSRYVGEFKEDKFCGAGRLITDGVCNRRDAVTCKLALG